MLVRGACCGTHCAATQLRSDNRSKSGLEGVCPAAHARPTPCASRHGQKGLAGSVPSLRLAWHAQRLRSSGPSAAMARVLFNPFWLRLRRGVCGVGMRVEARMLCELTCRGCLNGARQRAVSSAAHPASATPQVCPVAQAKGSQTWGRLFFAYFLLAKQKKVSAPPGAYPGQQHQKEELPATYQQALDAKINWSLTPIRLTPIRFPNRYKRVVNWNLTPIKGAGGVA